MDVHLAAMFTWFGREGVLCGCSLSCYVYLVWEGRSVVWMLAAMFAWVGREGVLCRCSLSCYVYLVWEGSLSVKPLLCAMT